jgi:DNA-binding CsgD family transcriptional regulator
LEGCVILRTAISHRERVMGKLDVHNRADPMKHAPKLGAIKL